MNIDIDMDKTSGSDTVPSDVIMNDGKLTTSTSNSSNSSESSNYSSSEEISVNQQILRSLPEDYKDRSIHKLVTVITICKEHYNAHAADNSKTLSSCPADKDQCFVLLQGLGQDARNELHDLVDHDKFAALVYHDSLRDPKDHLITEEQKQKVAQDSFGAFRCDYQGDAHLLLIDTMDFYIKKQDLRLYHNMCMPIVQSSGHGKSRMLQQASLLRFALPFNLREDPPSEFVGPPPDTNVRDHFLSFKHLPTDETEQRFMIFFQALFIEVKGELSTKLSNGESIHSNWHQRLNDGETSLRVGILRTTLYDRVVRRAKSIYKKAPRPAETEESLVMKAKELEAMVHSLAHNGKPKKRMTATFFIYFDECHTLTAPRFRAESLYDCLRSAMNALNEIAIFFITVSTNLKMAVMLPPPAHIPSLRYGDVHDYSKKLIPPFTELPFDIFAGNVKHHLPLVEYADRKNFRCFGRPLWFCEERNGAIAERKLLVDGMNDKLLLACLAILVHIDFDSKRETARTLESTLVESYMRVAFAVPEHREYMQTGYPSEPFLAEAAAKVLQKSDIPLKMLAPRLLADAVQAGFTSAGERGEVVTRLLYIIARHQVFVKNSAVDFSAIFHTPIKVVDFILALAPKRYREKIRQAKPTNVDDENLAPTFAVAFKDAYINFTHFQLGGEFELVKHCHLYKFLRRSMALQCRDNQRRVNNAVPMFFGDPTTTPVTEANSGSFVNQINQKQVGEVFIHPDIAEVKSNHPILTLVMDHGASPGIGEDRWEISDTAPISTQSCGTDIDKHHYRFVVHGCNSDSYAVIPKDADALYQSILAEKSAMDDFPRLDLAKNMFSAKSQMPSLHIDQL